MTQRTPQVNETKRIIYHVTIRQKRKMCNAIKRGFEFPRKKASAFLKTG